MRVLARTLAARAGNLVGANSAGNVIGTRKCAEARSGRGGVGTGADNRN